MWNIGDTIAILGVATGLPGIVMLIVLHVMLERRLGRLLATMISVATFPAEDMTSIELTMRRTGFTLFLGGSAAAAIGALVSHLLSRGSLWYGTETLRLGV